MVFGQNPDSPGIPDLRAHLCGIIFMLLIGVRRSFLTVGAAFPASWVVYNGDHQLDTSVLTILTAF